MFANIGKKLGQCIHVGDIKKYLISYLTELRTVKQVVKFIPNFIKVIIYIT